MEPIANNRPSFWKEVWMELDGVVDFWAREGDDNVTPADELKVLTSPAWPVLALLPCGGEAPDLPEMIDGERPLGRIDGGAREDGLADEPPGRKPEPDRYVDAGKPKNRPPVIDPIGDRSVYEGEHLSFDVSASDPDGDEIDYRADNLPEGAAFDEGLRRFSWNPTFRQSGFYDVTFFASDGKLETSEIITITAIDEWGDYDEDGFLEPEDCNDDDASIKPLDEYATNTIHEDTTICPGTYRGAKIRFSANNISLNANGVVLDNSEAAGTDTAISVSNRDSVFIRSGLTVTGYLTGVSISNSSNALVNGANITNIRKAIDIADSDHITVEDNTIIGGAVLLQYSSDNQILNNALTGPSPHQSKIYLNRADNNIIRGNRITEAYGACGLQDGALTLYTDSDNNIIEDNALENNHCGLQAGAGNQNVYRNNAVTNNAGNGMQIINQTATTVEGNQITNNNGYGIRMDSRSNHLIRNNNLTGNHLGNQLICWPDNTCYGNSE